MTNILKFAFYTVCSIYGSSFIVLMLLLRHWMNSFVIDPDYDSLFATVVANMGIIVGSIGMPILFHFYREAKRKDNEWECRVPKMNKIKSTPENTGKMVRYFSASGD